MIYMKPDIERLKKIKMKQVACENKITEAEREKKRVGQRRRERVGEKGERWKAREREEERGRSREA